MKTIHFTESFACAAACLLAVCSCVKEQLPTGGFGRGYIEPTVSFAGEMTKSSGTSPEGRYMGSYAMEGVGSDSLYRPAPLRSIASATQLLFALLIYFRNHICKTDIFKIIDS